MRFRTGCPDPRTALQSASKPTLRRNPAYRVGSSPGSLDSTAIDNSPLVKGMVTVNGKGGTQVAAHATF